jgi:predicted branched-subunit amino acid permease
MSAAVEPRHSILQGARAGVPFVIPTMAIGISFGVLAEPVIGAVAAIVMSVVVFAGAAQSAAVSALASGAGVPAAVAAGLLINGRFLPMGVAAAPALEGGPLRRGAEGQATVDASWAIAGRGDGTFDRELLVGAAVPQWLAWWTGTAIGALFGGLIGDPATFGLDAVFPAFFLALLIDELRARQAITVALLGAAIALLLIPIAPPGIPVLAAAAAALLGIRRRRNPAP